MPILNQQEKIILIFLLCTATIGAIIGLFRHNWIGNPEILLSPQNLPEVKIRATESKIITEHAQKINERDIVDQKHTDNTIDDNSSVVVEGNHRLIENTNVAQTESNKKNVTKNTSGLININSASKEDFMALPYIGEVKAELIIQLRNEMGVFTSIKDLEQVKGIGPKTLDKIEPFITI